MNTIECDDCGHVVIVQFGHKSKIGRGVCSHCGAIYEVSVVTLQKSPMSKEKLAERMNRHMG